MKAAPGAGIVSSIVMESDALDEVDWVSDRNMPCAVTHVELTTCSTGVHRR